MDGTTKSPSLHMNGGEGRHSYARNSKLQEKVMLQVLPAIEESISRLCDTFSSQCFRMADLGCSSGPNATQLAYEIIQIVNAESCKRNQQTPMFQIFFNDLAVNDFNVLFKTLPDFYTRLHDKKGSQFGPCFVAAVPGSFYGRLFPDDNIHFIHSCYSLHWLSHVPKGLLGEGAPVNKGSISSTFTNPPLVRKAYLDQFQQDFTSFLTSRAKELVPGGAMVLTFIGRANPDAYGHCVGVLDMALNELVSENWIAEAKVDSFNLPLYYPTPKEVKDVILAEGSFSVPKLEVFNIGWDEIITEVNDNIHDPSKRKDAKPITACLRAATEPILRNHFGDTIMDELFIRFEKIASQSMEKQQMKNTNLVLSMKRTA